MATSTIWGLPRLGQAGSRNVGSTTEFVPAPRAINTDVPLANVGEVIPYVIGRRRVSKPNVIAYGTPRALTETITTEETKTYQRPTGNFGNVVTYEDVTETTTVKKTIPIGFLTDITVGICLGPGVVLRGIYADNEPIWQGTAGPSRTVFTIGENDSAFSNCEVAFNGGAFNQPVDPWTTAPVAEPSLPGTITTGVGQNNTHEAQPTYVGLVSPGATPQFAPPVPETFGAVSASVNLFEIVNMYDMYQSGGSGTWTFGSILQVRGDTRSAYPTLNVSLNGGAPITVSVAGFHPQSNTTSYTMPMPQKFGFTPSTTYDISITPDGPGLPKDMPAYVGLAYVIIKDMRADVRLNNLSFEVERFPNPLGLTSGQNRKSDDINCATAMYDVLTSDWGGAGIDTQYVGSSFAAAALQFALEEGYCSIVLDSETSAGAVMGELMKQTYSIIYPDAETAKIEVKPIRQSALTLGSLRSFGRSSIIRFNEFRKNSWRDTLESLQATYPNRENNYEPTPLIAQSVSPSNRGGMRKSTNISYPFAPRVEIVRPAIARELAKALVPVFSANILVDRSGARCKPGDVILLNWPDYQIWSEPMVVSRVRKMPMKENTVALTVEQYRTPETSTVLAQMPDDPIPSIIDTRPAAPQDAFVLTAPFFLARAAGRVNLTTASNDLYPMFVPIPVNPLQLSYEVTVENAGASPVVTSSINDNILYPTYGQLSAPMSKYDGWETGVVGNIELDGVVNLVEILNMASTIREGRFLLLVDNEFFAFESVTDLGAERIRLNNVRRAVVDTVAADHAQGAHAFIISNNMSYVSPVAFSQPLSYTPTWRFISSTINESGKRSGPSTLVKSGWVPRARRSVASPRPHDTRIDGVRPQTPMQLGKAQQYTVSWRSRSRASTQLRFQNDPADENELYGSGVYQQHRVYLRDSGNTLRLLGTTADSANNINQLVVEIPAAAAAGAGTLFVRSLTSHGESVFDDELPVTVWEGMTTTSSYEIET